MGLQDRQYYQDRNEWGRQWRPEDDQRRQSMFGAPPRAVYTLIIINVAIAVVDLFFPRVVPEELVGVDGLTREQVAVAIDAPHWLGDFLALKTDVVQKPWRVFTLLTYGFVHSPLDGRSPGFWHLAGNMLVLYFLGQWVERRLGYYEFLRFYLVAIVLGGLAFLVSSLLQGEDRAVVGASGAVSAVLMLFVFMYPREKVLLFFVLPIPAWLLGAIVVGGDIFSALNPNNRIAVETHFAGLAFGAAYHYFGWNFRKFRIERLGAVFKSRPKLKVHRGGVDDTLQREADRVLKKIAEQGEGSLTSRERKTLKRYSEQVRRKRHQ